LTDAEIEALRVESHFKVEQYRSSLCRVFQLEEREELLWRMMSYVVIADLSMASNAGEVLASPYMKVFTPVDPTREFMTSNRTIGEINLNQLCNMLRPSRALTEILERRVGEAPRESEEESESDALDAVLSGLPPMGDLARIYVEIRDNGAVAPEFDRNVKGLIAFPVGMQANSEECFVKWYANIRKKFVETEAEGSLAQSLAALLQNLGRDFFISHLVLSPDEKNGALSLSLEILKKRYPDVLGQLQEAKRAFEDSRILEQYPQNLEEIEQIRKILETVVTPRE
jgi:hypothetical protein